jgi:hypothetical protein
LDGIGESGYHGRWRWWQVQGAPQERLVAPAKYETLVLNKAKQLFVFFLGGIARPSIEERSEQKKTKNFRKCVAVDLSQAILVQASWQSLP